MKNTPTILVISDSLEQFASTASILVDEGYDVRFENNVSSSSKMLAGDSPPHLIISELAAPNVDGLKLCRRIQADHSLDTTPVLLVGDLSITSSIVEDGFRCGAANYLQRPIDPLRLADICRDILQPNINRSSASIETRDDQLASTDRFDDSGSNFNDLLKNENLRTALFDNSRTGLAIFSASGKLIEGNPALRVMLDYSENELRGMTLSDFFFPHDRDTGTLAFEEIMTGKRDYYRSTNGYLTPSGERIWGSFTIIAINEADAGGVSRLLIGIFDEPASNHSEELNTSIRGLLSQDRGPAVLDLTKWKIDRGLICEN